MDEITESSFTTADIDEHASDSHKQYNLYDEHMMSQIQKVVKVILATKVKV